MQGNTGYAAHEHFVAPARARAEWWRTAAGLVVALIAGFALYQLGLALLASLLGPETMQAVWDEATFEGGGAGTIRGTLFTLLSFAFFGTGLAMAVRSIHGRDLWSLLGPWDVAVSDGLRVCLATGALFAGLLLLLPEGYETVRNPSMPVGLWLALVPLSLAAILVQAGTEELFFRGYLQQQIGARLSGWPAWMLVPALMFGAAHWAPASAGVNAGYYAVWGISFGCVAADLTARTGSLGAAIGLHLTNNAFALMGVALIGPSSGLALWHVPMAPDAPELAALMPVEFATLFVAWLAARLALKV